MQTYKPERLAHRKRGRLKQKDPAYGKDMAEIAWRLADLVLQVPAWGAACMDGIMPMMHGCHHAYDSMHAPMMPWAHGGEGCRRATAQRSPPCTHGISMCAALHSAALLPWSPHTLSHSQPRALRHVTTSHTSQETPQVRLSRRLNASTGPDPNSPRPPGNPNPYPNIPRPPGNTNPYP